jgi:hypothetical protein
VVDAEGKHRGTSSPSEAPIGWWTLVALLALVAGFFVFDDTGWRFAVGAGLFTVSMACFYITYRLINRGYPDL